MNAVEGWKEDLGDSAPLDVVLKKSERWIGSLDNLIDSLTLQVKVLRLAESQWMPARLQESGIIRGPVGTSEELLESKDIEKLIDRSTS
jgi:hypothetical protein